MSRHRHDCLSGHHPLCGACSTKGGGEVERSFDQGVGVMPVFALLPMLSGFAVRGHGGASDGPPTPSPTAPENVCNSSAQRGMPRERQCCLERI
jgi:hypothetical protein